MSIYFEKLDYASFLVILISTSQLEYDILNLCGHIMLNICKMLTRACIPNRKKKFFNSGEKCLTAYNNFWPEIIMRCLNKAGSFFKL